MKQLITRALEQIQYAYASMQTVNISVTRDNVTGMAGCILHMEEAMNDLKEALATEEKEGETDV